MVITINYILKHPGMVIFFSFTRGKMGLFELGIQYISLKTRYASEPNDFSLKVLFTMFRNTMFKSGIFLPYQKIPNHFEINEEI